MDDDPRPPDIRLEQEQELAAPADSSQSPALIGLSPLVASPSPLLDSLAAPASANTTTSAAPPSYPVWDYSLLGPAPESASRAAEAESADDTDTDTVMAQQLARDSGRQTLRSVIASIDSQLAAQRERRNRLRAADAGAAGMLTRQPAPVERLGQPASAWDSEAAPRAQRWDVDDGTLPPDDIEELLGVSREEWRRLAGSDGLSTDDDERDSAAALALASRVPLERARDSEESQQEELFYTSLRAGDESRERRTSTRGAQPPPTTRVTTTATATATSAAPQASRRRPRQDSQDWQVIWADSSSDASSRASSPVVTTYEPDEPLVAEQRRERELSERDAPPATEERTRDARIQANLNAARELVQAAIAARPRPTQVRDAQSAATSTSSSATTAAAATGAGGTASTMTARGATGPPRRQPEIRVFPRGTASSAVSSTNAFTWNPRPRDRTSNVIGERISRAPIATTTTAQGLAAQWPAYRHARLGSLPRLSGAGMWRAQPVMLVYCGKSPDPIGSDDDDTGSCSDEDDFSDEDEDDEDSSSVPRGAKRAYDDQDGLEAAAAARRRRLRAKARETAGTGCGALLCARALDDNSSTRIFPNEGNHNGAGRSRKSAAAAGRPTKGRKPEKVVRSDLAPCPRVCVACLCSAALAPSADNNTVPRQSRSSSTLASTILTPTPVCKGRVDAWVASHVAACTSASAAPSVATSSASMSCEPATLASMLPTWTVPIWASPSSRRCRRTSLALAPRGCSTATTTVPSRPSPAATATTRRTGLSSFTRRRRPCSHGTSAGRTCRSPRASTTLHLRAMSPTHPQRAKSKRAMRSLAACAGPAHRCTTRTRSASSCRRQTGSSRRE